MNPMSWKRRLMAGVVLGVIFVALEFTVHHVFLKSLYHEVTALWRDRAGMRALFPFIPIAELLFGVLFGVVYAQGYEPRRAPLGQGLRYGLIMGLMLAPMSLIWFVLLPVPAALGAAWFAASFLEMVILGLLASMVYRPAN